MTGDRHVRFCESGRGRFPPATHQGVIGPYRNNRLTSAFHACTPPEQGVSAKTAVLQGIIGLLTTNDPSQEGTF